MVIEPPHSWVVFNLYGRYRAKKQEIVCLSTALLYNIFVKKTMIFRQENSFFTFFYWCPRPAMPA